LFGHRLFRHRLFHQGSLRRSWASQALGFQQYDPSIMRM
jgi:hypothetical protein